MMGENELIFWAFKTELFHVHVEDLFGPGKKIPDLLILVIESFTHANVLRPLSRKKKNEASVTHKYSSVF
jgi:hypothetical protein